MLLPRNQIPEEIAAYLAYDPNTGALTWIAGRMAGRVPGQIAGKIDKQGYRRVSFRGTSYAAHRITWFLTTGEQPPEMLDHADCDKDNNRFLNLRVATPAQNNANWKAKGSLPKGTTLHSTGKYQASIKLAGKSHYLGLFVTAEEAHAAYAAKAAELFGEFARAA